MVSSLNPSTRVQDNACSILCIFYQWLEQLHHLRVVSSSSSHAEAHVAIHFQTTSIVHGLLLLLQLAHLFSNSVALRNWTFGIFALLGVNAKQCPDALTDFTSTLHFYLTACSMYQIIFHFLAVCGRTLFWFTSGGMLNQLNVHQ